MDLDAKLGPILWQMHPFKKFEEEDFAAFHELLPPRMHGTALRHVVEGRHASFVDAKFVEGGTSIHYLEGWLDQHKR